MILRMRETSALVLYRTNEARRLRGEGGIRGTAIRNNAQPNELTVIDAVSYPPIDQLKPLEEPLRTLGKSVLRP